MSSRKFALVEGGEKRLEIAQPLFSNKRIIKLDGKKIGEIPNQKALKAGWAIKDKSGVELSIQSCASLLNSKGLDIRFKGKPVPNSDSNPKTRLSYAWQICYVIGFLTIVFSLVWTVFPGVPGLTFSQYGGYTGIVSGLLYLIVGYFVQRRSKIALALAITGMILDSVLLIVSFPQMIRMGLYSSSSVGGIVGGVFVRFFMVLYMFQGFGAISELKAQEPAE